MTLYRKARIIMPFDFILIRYLFKYVVGLLHWIFLSSSLALLYTVQQHIGVFYTVYSVDFTWLKLNKEDYL